MELSPAIDRFIETEFINYLGSSLRGTDPLTTHTDPGSFTYDMFSLPDTVSNTYEQIYISKFKLEDIGQLQVFTINVLITTQVKGNGSIKWEISGDGGTTWGKIIEESFNEADFIDITRSGSGLWISNINIGTDKLQIRMSGLANSGTVNLKLSDISTIRIEYIQIV